MVKRLEQAQKEDLVEPGGEGLRVGEQDAGAQSQIWFHTPHTHTSAAPLHHASPRCYFHKKGLRDVPAPLGPFLPLLSTPLLCLFLIDEETQKGQVTKS